MQTPTKRSEKAKFWCEFVETQSRSGKSVSAFCKERKVNRYTFFYWKKKFQEAKPSERGRRFVVLDGGQGSDLSSARIHLPNGVRIELGAGAETEAVGQLLCSLCGVNHAKS